MEGNLGVNKLCKIIAEINRRGISIAEKKREFIDERPHKFREAFYALQEKYNGSNGKYIRIQLEQLIKRDPYYLDPYLLLYMILEDEGNLKEAEKMLNNAYKRALKMITDENGNWPDIMRWGHIENRHIIRAILNKAILLWREKKTEEALDLLRKLLRTNPNDNIGARDYILAIRMNMSFEEFERRFNKGGYYDIDLVNWFDENYKKFPDEFEWWEKTIEE